MYFDSKLHCKLHSCVVWIFETTQQSTQLCSLDVWNYTVKYTAMYFGFLKLHRQLQSCVLLILKILHSKLWLKKMLRHLEFHSPNLVNVFDVFVNVEFWLSEKKRSVPINTRLHTALTFVHWTYTLRIESIAQLKSMCLTAALCTI